MMGVYYIQMDGLQTSLIISVTGETIIIIEAVVSRAGRQAGRQEGPDSQTLEVVAFHADVAEDEAQLDK